MKKTLIVAAALAACGLAQAQSSATLYGNVDLSLESMKVTGQSAQTRVTSGAGAPSKWGLRGEEDLGNGLKAMFNLEAGFSADTGGVSAGKAFSRLANVGLKSATLGELRLGKQWSPLADSMVWTDSDYASNFSPITPLLLNGVAGPMHLRPDNAISYSSPVFGGFSGKFLYAPSEVSGTDAMTDGSLTYRSGPVLANLAFHHEGKKSGAGGFESRNAYNLDASYDFRVAKVSGNYYRAKTDLAGALGDPKVNGTVFGVTVPSGKLTYVAQYGFTSDNSVKWDGSAKAKGKSEHLNLGVNYAFSKRTIGYARLAKVMDENGAFNGGNAFGGQIGAYGVVGEVNGMPANGSGRTAAVGILHFF
ncbi:porin [Malikia spinosa]|uniref:porin n=1 Tax=Malikia spinosa TaxID=86180 RepID=UPI0026C3FBD1